MMETFLVLKRFPVIHDVMQPLYCGHLTNVDNPSDVDIFHGPKPTFYPVLSPCHTGKDTVRTVLGHATIRNFVQIIRSIPDRNTVLGHVLTLSWVS